MRVKYEFEIEDIGDCYDCHLGYMEWGQLSEEDDILHCVLGFASSECPLIAISKEDRNNE